ncbi:MAG: hypothetical protein JSW66_07370 [Phycisphaerales bacterium]|nr:MAG: hypothetical protein JSW66_07370 [Phycisphaerales bacterium]
MRNMRLQFVFATALVFMTLIASEVRAGISIDIEAGVASSGYNDIRIPGNTGSDISLTDDLKSDESEFWRARLGIGLGQKHRLSLLVAPLRLESSGSVDRAIDYNGVTFEAGEALSARYRFDSYRLTYSYALVQSDRLDFDIGFTAKIRDAAIRIESEQRSSEKTNTGFVPLINFGVDWSFTSQFGLLIQGDALAAPQGRAEDVLLAPYADLSDRLRFRVGYRILEGGADNDEVYTFALVHYLSAGVSWTF